MDLFQKKKASFAKSSILDGRLGSANQGLDFDHLRKSSKRKNESLDYDFG